MLKIKFGKRDFGFLWRTVGELWRTVKKRLLYTMKAASFSFSLGTYYFISLIIMLLPVVPCGKESQTCGERLNICGNLQKKAASIFHEAASIGLTLFEKIHFLLKKHLVFSVVKTACFAELQRRDHCPKNTIIAESIVFPKFE